MSHTRRIRESTVFFLLTVLASFMLHCVRADTKKTGSHGTVIVVYGSEACECIRRQGETVLRRIDSLRAADSRLCANFNFKLLDRAGDGQAADEILDRCENPLPPVVRLEDPEGFPLFESSFEFDHGLFIQKLKDCMNNPSTSSQRGS